MTEMEFIHLLRMSFPTQFRFLILYTALLQKMPARGKRDGTNCEIFFDAANPISGKSTQLRSPTPIYIYIFLLVEYKNVILNLSSVFMLYT